MFILLYCFISTTILLPLLLIDITIIIVVVIVIFIAIVMCIYMEHIYIYIHSSTHMRPYKLRGAVFHLWPLAE